MAEPGLRIFSSNRLEVLLDALAERMLHDPPPPAESERILVQSHGIARWVTLELSRRLGVAASLDFAFPGPYCRHIATRLMGVGDDAPVGPSGFDRPGLQWRSFDWLNQLSEDSRTAPLRDYLRDDPDGRKQLQLSRRLAVLFDGYQLFRPQRLRAWRDGEPGSRGSANETWQAALWSDLVRERPDESPLCDLLLDSLELLRQAQPRLDGLPERLEVFGVTSLPPVMLEFLTGLSAHRAVNISFVVPTTEYWGELRSERTAARHELREGSGAAEREHFEVGHPLLAAWGRQGQEFFELLQEHDPEGTAWRPLPSEPPTGDSVLAQLQRDILELVDRSAQSGRLDLGHGDRSLRVHVCHSPMREMEVLRNELLRAFEDDDRLRPDDVLILMPDVERYAPYVNAVFGRKGPDQLVLPYRIADRSLLREQPLARLIRHLLQLVDGRRSSAEILDLLEIEAVARRFELELADRGWLRDRLRDAGVRWGADPRQRSRDFEVPEFPEGTWQQGMDRLLLGFATGSIESSVGELLPCADQTLNRAEQLGQLAEMVQTIMDALERLRGPYNLQEWTRRLLETVDAITRFDRDEEEEGRRLVRQALLDSPALTNALQLRPELQLPAFRDHVLETLNDPGPARGFLTGGMTFAALRPLRTVPFAVVAVVGLDDGVFPRADISADFDLMQGDRRRGDRNVRDDDRYLFLEILLAARRRLILSTVGRSQLDDGERPPSVLLSELLDQLDRSFRPIDGEAPSSFVRVEHRLQPFSERYFDDSDPEFFSYDSENLVGARSRGEPGHDLPRFVIAGPNAPPEGMGPAEEPDEASQLIMLEDFREFWNNPCRWYCTRTLGLILGEADEAIPESEPFEVDKLERFRAADWALQRERRGDHVSAEELELVRQRFMWPAAASGDVFVDQLRFDVRRLARRCPSATALPPAEIDVEGENWRIRGRLDQLSTAGRIIVRPSKLRARLRLSLWIDHLILGLLDAEGRGEVPWRTLFIGESDSLRLEEIEDAREKLAPLVTAYVAGRDSPLSFYPETSFVYRREYWLDRPDEPDNPLLQHGKKSQRKRSLDSRFPLRNSELRKAWESGPSGRGGPGESQDEAVRLCTRGLDESQVFGPDFQSLAEVVWDPYLRASEGGTFTS